MVDPRPSRLGAARILLPKAIVERSPFLFKKLLNSLTLCRGSLKEVVSHKIHSAERLGLAVQRLKNNLGVIRLTQRAAATRRYRLWSVAIVVNLVSPRNLLWCPAHSTRTGKK